MSNSRNLVDNAVEAAKKAVQFDEEGEANIAAYYYESASRLLAQAALIAEPDQQDSLNTKSEQYNNRASELRNKTPEVHKIDETSNAKTTKLKQCYFLLQQAIEEDEQGDKEDAIELYAKTVEYVTENPELMQGEFKKLAVQALERAEELKGWCIYVVFKSICISHPQN